MQDGAVLRGAAVLVGMTVDVSGLPSSVVSCTDTS